MKKIMFNDRFGLTEAVLNRQKTMTRRIAYGKELAHELQTGRDDGGHFLMLDGDKTVARSAYHIGEEVAIAQSYATVQKEMKRFRAILNNDYQYEFFRIETLYNNKIESSPAWTNKLFVRSDLMPHSIRITGIKLERLQDISDADCRREGIVPITWRQYHKQALDDLSPQRYTDHHVYTLEKFREGISDPWADSDPDEYLAETPQIAFAVLVSRTMGRKVWEQNPYVFVYTFALLK